MKRWIRYLAMGLIGGGMTVMQAAGEESAPLAPRVVCAETLYDFGERENSGTVEHDYVLRNEGTLSLEIRNVRASCGCTAVRSSHDVLPPGGEGTIHARFDLRGRSGPQLKTITVECNDPKQPSFVLQLKGTAVQALRAVPASLFFGRLGRGAVRERTFDILSTKGPFEVLETRVDSPYMTVTALPQPPDPNMRSFRLVLADELPQGVLQGNVVIRTDAPNGQDITVPVQAFVTGEGASAQGP